MVPLAGREDIKPMVLVRKLKTQTPNFSHMKPMVLVSKYERNYHMLVRLPSTQVLIRVP
jgi:ribosomal protein L11